MAWTWPMEVATFLQDKVCYQLPQAFVWSLFFHSGSQSHSNFPCVHPLAGCPVEDSVERWTPAEMIFPRKLWRNDHLNSDSITVLLSQTVLIRVWAKSISSFLGARFVLRLLGKWLYFHFLSWYTYCLFVAVRVYVDIGNLTSLPYWLLN